MPGSHSGYRVFLGIAVAVFAVVAHGHEMCPLDSSYPGFSESNTHPQESRSDVLTAGQCFISWQDVADDLSGYQLVDIRKAEDYENIRLLSAIHIPPQQIKTKNFLRKRKVLLIGYGFERRSQLPLCGELREQGFEKLYFLEGGMAAARRNGGHLGGQDPASRARLISPEQVVGEYFSDGLHLIVEDRDLLVVLRDFGVTATYLDQPMGSKAWTLAALQIQLQNTPEGTPKRPLVAVGEHGPVMSEDNASRHDVWQLATDAEELIRFLDRSEWVKINRNNEQTRFQCPNV